MSQIHRRSFLRQTAGAGIGLWVAGQSGGRAAEPNAAPFPTVTLEGSPEERGLVHGKTLKEPIHQLVKLWKADLAERYKMDADAFIKKFLKQTEYPAAIKKWTPDLLDEVAGIAKGAGLDFDTMLVFQLIDEYWVHGPGVAGEHCSALGFARRGERPGYIAQNMDLEGFRSGFQAVLHIKQPKAKAEAFVLTHAGLIGLNGLNHRAIGICCNTLGQLAYCGDGLPVACVVRGVLERESEEAALAFLRAVKHASGQNYIIGGPDNVYDFECSAGKVSCFTPNGGAGVVWHTNHPLVNDDYNAGHRQALAKKETEKKEANTRARLQALEKRWGKDAPAPGLELIKTTLASKDSPEFPVCRPFKNKKENCTFAATIMVLAAKPELHVAPGPPDVQPYRTLTFAR
jgi:hypothetical protein